MPAGLAKDVDRIIAAAATPPMRVARAGILTWEITDDFIGWAGMNRASEGRGGAVDVSPVVGVRHGECERIVARLGDSRDDGVIPPTLSVQLGYVMPEADYRYWRFDDPALAPRVAEELVGALREHGMPWAEQYADLERIYREGFGRYSIEEHRMDREPVVARLLGRPDEADERLEAWLRSLGERDDLAARAYRSFAEAFRNSKTL
jgi:hypothetical protein